MYCHLCSCVRDTEVDEENEGIGKVEKADDDQDASRDQVRQEQFNRFAMAMALDDDDMAEQAMQGFGYNLILLQTICLCMESEHQSCLHLATCSSSLSKTSHKQVICRLTIVF